MQTIARYENICNYIHLPVQSGSTSVLQRMNRTYTREWYMSKIRRIREMIPDCGISSDIISGFCGGNRRRSPGNTFLMRECRFDMSYMYFYSERPGTLAAKRYPDDIPESEKKRRLDEIVKLQNKISQKSNLDDLGSVSKVLIEGDSKKSSLFWMGRNNQNKVVVFPKATLQFQKGDYAFVKIEKCTGATLIGQSI